VAFLLEHEAKSKTEAMPVTPVILVK